ncbi:BatA domain-containing protein [Hanstruepera ponticola]|uniref:BatA domain-containing protein n=1 Tax=Hanstruepera ponticola TaxID=2042995 RepID=UPI000CF1AE75|nr:BatA and WFA domain-containing protein [Hanstruepera ponticola]
MQFKHPEILYALCLLIIPIIIHLFQLRRFQKEAFTNVAFLKQVVIQTRKSSQLKKWLTLLTRMLLLACVIIAFAQPFTSKSTTFSTTPETVIYLDNSFSLQAKGEQGELLKRAIQDMIDEINPDDKISILTNDVVFKNTTIKTIQNDLLQLEYASNQMPYDAALLKSKNLFSQNATNKNLIFVSDFQQKEADFSLENDSLYQVNLVKLEPVNTSNISIDSAYVEKTSANSLQLQVILKNNGNPVDNLPISLFDDDKLLAKTSTDIENETQITFTLSNQEISHGKIIVDDNSLQFDNTLFFNLNKPPKTNVLNINNAEDIFIKRLYASDEFEYSATTLSELNYSVIDNQNLIILNELEQIPSSLSNSLNSFIANGGFVIVIPSGNSDLNSYNSLLSQYAIKFDEKLNTEKRVTQISYAHPIYENVFDKQVSNFQYPKINAYFPVVSAGNLEPLKFEDGRGFLIESDQLYVFTAPLNPKNSSFSNSPLIVPTFYNIARQSLKTPQLYYTIGVENQFDVTTTMQQDDILSIKNENLNIIPQQQYFNSKVTLITKDLPNLAGVYNITNKAELITKISYNYNRGESVLRYQDITNITHATVSNSLADMIKTLKSDSKINELWKWFIIFALAFLIIEMLILKYFK